MSIAGLALAIPLILEGLMAFSSDFKAAKKEIVAYVGDLFTLEGILAYIESMRAVQTWAKMNQHDSAAFTRLLEGTRPTIILLQRSLQPKNLHFRQSSQCLTWNLKKKKAHENLDRIGKLKDTLLLVLMGDSPYAFSVFWITNLFLILSHSSTNQTILSKNFRLRHQFSDDR